jgi:nucleotide-binding universal stress UspA family protein
VESRSSDSQIGDRLVVGIGDSGPDHYRAALGLAAQMSGQRDATITLVHGSLPRLSIATGGEALERHLTRGRQIVDQAELALSAMVDPGTRISLAAVPRTGVDALLHESQSATSLIVQRRSVSAVYRTFTGATSHTVAAQAACPVIVVRHDQFESDSKRGVVVGVTPDSGQRALETAVAEAAARKCPLTAVYVWNLQFSPTYGGQIEPDEEEVEEAASWADSQLANAVARVAKKHPDVEIRARSVKGVIEVGLLQECEHAELLVVERHRDAHRASIGLGTLTRHLIEHAPCPIMITPQSHVADHSDDLDATEPDAKTQL